MPNQIHVIQNKTVDTQAIFTGNSKEIELSFGSLNPTFSQTHNRLLLALLLMFGVGGLSSHVAAMSSRTAGQALIVTMNQLTSNSTFQQAEKELTQFLEQEGFDVQTVAFDGEARKVALSSNASKRFQALKNLDSLTAHATVKKAMVHAHRKDHVGPVVMAALRGSALRLSMLSSDNQPLVRLIGAGALPLALEVETRR